MKGEAMKLTNEGKTMLAAAAIALALWLALAAVIGHWAGVW